MSHAISAQGVSMDMQKVESGLNWSQLTTLKGLRGLPGLTGSYRRFIRGYGAIVRPLNNLLKKGNCIWNQADDETFF